MFLFLTRYNFDKSIIHIIFAEMKFIKESLIFFSHTRYCEDFIVLIQCLYNCERAIVNKSFKCKNLTRISNIVVEEGLGPCMHFEYDIFRPDSKHINVWCCWSLRISDCESLTEYEWTSSILENERWDWSTHFALIASQLHVDWYKKMDSKQAPGDSTNHRKLAKLSINFVLMYDKIFLLFWIFCNSVFRVANFLFNLRILIITFFINSTQSVPFQ